jgi:hypothetical protein
MPRHFTTMTENDATRVALRKKKVSNKQAARKRQALIRKASMRRRQRRLQGPAETVSPEYMRLRNFARLIDVDPRTLARYLAAGMPCLGARRHARIVHVPDALAWLSERAGKRRRGRPRNVDRDLDSDTIE